MSKFGDVRQKDRLFSSVSSKAFLQAADTLPSVSNSEGLFVQTSIRPTTTPSGVIYAKRTVGGQTVWKPADISKFGAPTAPVFQSKRITQDAIFLRWKSGKNDAGDWAYDVVVRKLGGIPSRPDDGEIVGYSSVADQYAHPVDGTGKVSIPDWMIDTELYRGFIVPVTDTSLQYTYKIFSVSTSGDFEASDAIPGYWTYTDIKQTIIDKVHRVSFRLGDVLTLPNNTLADGAELHAQIVSFNYRYHNNDVSENIVFMMCESIINEPFDAETNEYGSSRMRAWAELVAREFGDEFYGLLGIAPVATMTRDFRAYSATANSKMWIPSFMEIYGRYPIGANNDLYSAEKDDDAVKNMWKRINPNSVDYKPDIEGQQFDLFKKLTGNDLYEARKRYTLSRETCQWYLRTMSLFKKSGKTLQVFYVPRSTSAKTVLDVAADVNSTVDIPTEDNPTTQPVFCFRIDDIVYDKNNPPPKITPFKSKNYIQDACPLLLDGIDNSGYGESDKTVGMFNLRDSAATTANIPLLANKRVWSQDEMGIEIPAGTAYDNNLQVNSLLSSVVAHTLRTAEVVCYSTESAYNAVVWWCSNTSDGWAAVLRSGIDVGTKQYIALRLGNDRGALLSSLLASSEKIIGEPGGYGDEGNLRVFSRGTGSYGFHVGLCALRCHTRDLTEVELKLNKVIDITRYGLTS